MNTNIFTDDKGRSFLFTDENAAEAGIKMLRVERYTDPFGPSRVGPTYLSPQLNVDLLNDFMRLYLKNEGYE